MKNIFILLLSFYCFQGFSQTITATISYQGYDESQAYFGEGEYEIFLDNVDGVLDKPIIVIDGFDPGDGRNIPALYAALDFNGSNLADILRDEGYDMVALNFPQYTTDGKDIDGGADYIQRNAMVLIELINLINNQKVGSQELVVIGPSMGGLIARYGLSYMEQNSLVHETRLYISFDSPHLGANIPIGFQYLINYFAKDQGNAEAQLIVDNVLNSAAAKEMLIDHYSGHLMSGSDFEQDPTLLLPVGAPNFRDAFQTELDNLGFPQNVRNVSMINGSGQGMTTGLPGAQIVDTNIDLGSGLDVDIALHFTPEAGAVNNVTDFTGYFNGIPLTSFSADAESFNYTGGLDSSPGGTSSMSGSLEGVDNPIIIALFDALEQDDYSFIPTISALAIDSESDWYATSNIGNSPFINTYMPTENEAHVTLTEGNANFALNEIRETLSVGDNVFNSKFKLVKNPVTEQIIIRLDTSQFYSNLELAIYDVSGQQVLSKNLQNPTNEIVLNHNLSSGIYILNIRDSGMIYTIKMIVN